MSNKIKSEIMKTLRLVLLLPFLWAVLVLFRPASKVFMDTMRLDLGWRGALGVLLTIAIMAVVLILLPKHPIVASCYFILGIALGISEGWFKGSYKLIKGSK